MLKGLFAIFFYHYRSCLKKLSKQKQVDFNIYIGKQCRQVEKRFIMVWCTLQNSINFGTIVIMEKS